MDSEKSLEAFYQPTSMPEYFEYECMRCKAITPILESEYELFIDKLKNLSSLQKT